MSRQPALFLSHGAPNLVLQPEQEAHKFMLALGKELPKPKGVLVISAHFQNEDLTLSVPPDEQLMYDFYGFERELYQVSYPAQGAPWLTDLVAKRLEQVEIDFRCTKRPYDHGAWSPLKLMFPKADIPVVPLSLKLNQGPDWHYRLGQSLAPLREQGVLILGSGGASHNLRQLNATGKKPERWMSEFVSWLDERVVHAEHDDLCDYRSHAPYGLLNHPTDEHLLPLFVVVGSQYSDESANRIYQGVQYQNLSLNSYGIGMNQVV